MSIMRLTYRKKGYEVNVYHSDHSKSRKEVSYTNIIDKDPNKIAQILLDLQIAHNFPIEKAIKIFQDKLDNKDWLGF